MRKIIVTLAACAAIFSASGAIRWLEKDYDFGLFKEVGGPKTGTSRFVNLGPDTIAIMDVHPSCGCTSTDFTPTPIAPGDTATIHYTYDPSMRPGKFDKTVRVTLSDGTRQIIRIRGNVLGTPESLATLYPIDNGPLRLSEDIVSFGEVTFGRTPVAFLNAYVLHNDSVAPTIENNSKALTIIPSSETAGPGDIITFTFNLNTRELNQYGPVELPVSIGLKSGTADTAEGRIKVRAVVLPDATDLALHQQGKSPAIDLNTGVVDLGTLSGSPVQAEFTVTNNGKAPLELLRIYPSTEAIKIGKAPQTVKPGKSAKIRIDVDPAMLNAGPQRHTIEILTNDPVHPRTTLTLPLNIP